MRRFLLASAFIGSVSLSAGACSSTTTGSGFVPDGGAGTGGVGGGNAGTTCSTLCTKMVNAGCPNAKPQGMCEADCINPPLVNASCKSAWDSYVNCGATQGGVACSADGLPLVTGCDAQLQAFTDCQGGGNGGSGGVSGSGGIAGSGNAPGGGGTPSGGGAPSGGGGGPTGGGGSPPVGGGGGPTGGGGSPPVGGGGGPTGGGGSPPVGGGGAPSGGGGSPGTLPPGCWTGPTPECNPLTNSGCASGDACDYGQVTVGINGVGCFPPPNTVPANGACNNSTGPYCIPTYHCSGSPGTCRKFCCSSSDCGGGTCTTLSTMGTLGYCS